MKFVGIDLGTTNSSLAHSDGSEIQDLDIFQLVSEDTVLASKWLPSFLYLLHENEFVSYPEDSLVSGLGFCGALARKKLGSESHRVVHSAKSWIGLGSQSSDSEILPFSEMATKKVSAVMAQAAYLKYLRQSYTRQCGPLPSQVILTIPASFGDVSRSLTIKASRLAGFESVLLLEEPLAAFYNWQHYHSIRELPKSVLVIDIGGGTTDFSLLCLKDNRYSREAVGRHLLLGGDNLDLFLALKVEAEFGFKLSPSEFSEILSQCRDFKEVLLGDSEFQETLKFTLAGRGSSLFQKARVLTINALSLKSALMEGFFPLIQEFDLDRPAGSDLGIRQFGLPYEKNPAITEHLRLFLKSHAPRLCKDGPEAVLFHGGSLFSLEIQSRLLECMALWFPRAPMVLKNPDMRLGVSHGACIYALARQGQAQLIDAGLAQSCFVGIELKDKSQSLLCVAHSSQKESQRESPDLVLQLRSQKTVQFPLYRLDLEDARVGTIVPHQGELPVSIVETRITNQDSVVPVRLESELMPTGELRLILKNQRQDEKYCLDFAILQDMQKIRQNQFPFLKSMFEVLGPVYGKGGEIISPKQIRGLIRELQNVSTMSKDKWPVLLCRKLALWLVEEQRAKRRSEIHEQMYYSLLGFCSRPGFGFVQDQELIPRIETGFTTFVKSPQNRIEYWILIRRIAGGLSPRFQCSLFESYGWYVTGCKQGLKLPGIPPNDQEKKEMIRAFVSMEWLETKDRLLLFEKLFRQLKSNTLPEADLWMLQRLCTRNPYYADPNRVLPSSWALGLLEFLSEQTSLSQPHTRLARELLSRRGHRDYDFNESDRSRFTQRFGLSLIENEPGEFEDSYGFGEGLPLGLRLPNHAQ